MKVIKLFCYYPLLITYDRLITGDFKYFDSELRVTLASKDYDLYSGAITITSETITIDGYGEDWASIVCDDRQRPFKDIPKRKPHKGYSGDGKIFIGYGETAKDGIPYIYTEGGPYSQMYKLLEFTFGGREEILGFRKNF